MEVELYRTGNSRTEIAFHSDWLVLDLGSGHNPHPRADFLADKFLMDDTERSGQRVVLPKSKQFVVADACAMPFGDKAFDFVICSHVAEHIEDVDKFCAELNRIAHGGYLETPSKVAELLRHAPNHRWYVSVGHDGLRFEPTKEGHPLGWFGKLFFSIYFYQTIQIEGRDVFRLAYGVPKPWHFVLYHMRRLLVRLWLNQTAITYTRFLWKDGFHWKVLK